MARASRLSLSATSRPDDGGLAWTWRFRTWINRTSARRVTTVSEPGAPRFISRTSRGTTLSPSEGHPVEGANMDTVGQTVEHGTAEIGIIGKVAT